MTEDRLNTELAAQLQELTTAGLLGFSPVLTALSVALLRKQEK